MGVRHVTGDLLAAAPTLDYICHQVNCCGVMGSGIAYKIREKYPVVYNKYKDWYIGAEKCPLNENKQMFGHIQVIEVEPELSIVNLAAQRYYGNDGKRYTSYDAFWTCLNELKEKVPTGSKIGFPGYIGCGLGGANWPIIYSMIWEVLAKDYEVYIYYLP